MTTTSEAASGSSIKDCWPVTAFRPSDQRLAALLESKPATDEVPLETWWHLAESLQHSVVVRRAREGAAVLDAATLEHKTYQARWSAQAALAHLGPGPSRRPPVGRLGQPNVRATVRTLARFIVSPRPTPRENLRGAVLDHLDALGHPR